MVAPHGGTRWHFMKSRAICTGERSITEEGAMGRVCRQDGGHKECRHSLYGTIPYKTISWKNVKEMGGQHLNWPSKTMLWWWEVDGTGSGSCSMVSCIIGGAEPPSSATNMCVIKLVVCPWFCTVRGAISLDQWEYQQFQVSENKRQTERDGDRHGVYSVGQELNFVARKILRRDGFPKFWVVPSFKLTKIKSLPQGGGGFPYYATCHYQIINIPQPFGIQK
jgi:hypothetical protein